jgi:DNA helicase-2/ATP-dependent DNA helicase PcrA
MEVNYLQKLNQSQLTAAQWVNSPLLVLAGPGSGKIDALTARIKKIVQEHSVAERAAFTILCLTLTRKAETEIQTKLEDLISDSRNHIKVMTFQEFITNGFNTQCGYFSFTPKSFKVIDEFEKLKIIKSIIDKKHGEFAMLVSAEQALKSINFLLRNAISDSQVCSVIKNQRVCKQLQTLFSEYKQNLVQQNCLDCESIPYFFEQLIREHAGIRNMLPRIYRYLCVDDFQAMSTTQFRIMKAIALDKTSKLFLTSDDDQTIYQSNGVSPSMLSELKQIYDIKIIRLPENHKCPAALVEIANSLIAHNSDHVAIEKLPPKKLSLSTKKVNKWNPIELVHFETDKDESNDIACLVRDYLMSGVQPIDIVVLARTPSMLSEVRHVLDIWSVPNYLQTNGIQFESAPLRFIILALKLAIVRFDKGLASDIMKSLADCVGNDLVEEDLSNIYGFPDCDNLDSLNTFVTDNPSISNLLQKAIQELVRGNYRTFVQNTLSYFDVLELAINPGQNEQFLEYTTERNIWQNIINQLGGEDKAYALSLSEFLQEVALTSMISEAPLNAVRCLTISNAKDIEFKHAFLIGLAEGKLPSFQSINAGNHSRKMQEERRNCFVAITKTTERLTLSYAREYNGRPTNPSRFLVEMGFSEVQEQTPLTMAV